MSTAARKRRGHVRHDRELMLRTVLVDLAVARVERMHALVNRPQLDSLASTVLVTAG